VSRSDLVDWWFRSRVDGTLVVGQLPNRLLVLWFVLTVIRLVFRPTGTLGVVLDGVALVALLVWSIDELWRGVNPFRRLIGGLVLLFLVVTRLVGLAAELAGALGP
jgi:hypothetical protein